MKLETMVIGILLFYLIILILDYYSSNSGTTNPSVGFENYFNHSNFFENNYSNENSSFQADAIIQNNCPIYFSVLDFEKATEIYEYKNYGPCLLASNDFISFKQGLNVKCESGENPQYFFKDEPQRLGGYKTNVKWLPSAEGYESTDYLLIKCAKNSIHTFVFNRYQNTISKNANLIKNNLEADKKPFNVLLIVLDVVSRVSAYENLPKTVEFLKKGYKTRGISAYEFQKTLVPEVHTVNNMTPIIYGFSYEIITNEYGQSGIKQIKPKKETIEKQIWTHYKKLGYTTMFLHDSLWNFLSSAIGKDIECDHVFVNYWKTAYSVYGWHDTSETQRCAGSQNSHNLSLNYTYQYFNNYPENNKFAYVHTNAAHENSGNVRTIDNDLVQFIQNFIDLMKSKSENFAMFVIGDHGRSKDNRKFELSDYFDSRSAFTSLYLSKDVEEKWNLKQLLTGNSQKLISRFDINLSLKHLAYYPYNKKDLLDYSKLKEGYKLKSVSSIFKEPLSINRTCEDLGVKKEFCLCRWIEPMPNIQSEDPSLFNNLLQLLNKYIEKRSTTLSNCEPIKTVENIKVSRFEINPDYKGKATIFYLNFTANSFFNLEAKINYCYQSYLKTLNINLPEVKLPYSLFTHKSIPTYLQFDWIKTENPQIPELCL